MRLLAPYSPYSHWSCYQLLTHMSFQYPVILFIFLFIFILYIFQFFVLFNSIHNAYIGFCWWFFTMFLHIYSPFYAVFFVIYFFANLIPISIHFICIQKILHLTFSIVLKGGSVTISFVKFLMRRWFSVVNTTYYPKALIVSSTPVLLFYTHLLEIYAFLSPYSYCFATCRTIFTVSTLFLYPNILCYFYVFVSRPPIYLRALKMPKSADLLLKLDSSIVV